MHKKISTWNKKTWASLLAVIFSLYACSLSPWIFEKSYQLIDHTEKELTNYCISFSYPQKSSCYIRKSILDQKIKKGLPEWAKAQIQEDLGHFGKIKYSHLKKYQQVPRESELPLEPDIQYSGLLNDLSTIEIKNRKLLYDPKSSRNSSLNGAYLIMADAFKYLAKQGYIPDTYFLMAQSDYFYSSTISPVPIFVFAKDLKQPSEENLILMPDHMNLMEISTLRPMIQKAKKKFPWNQKEPLLFWRGANTSTIRQQLILWSKEYPTLIDAKFLGPGVPFVSPADHLKYKYLLSIDGIRATWTRFVWHLQANSLTFKVDSPHWQWFYKGVKPYVDYVPVHDKASLVKAIQWAETYPDKAQKITQNASTFAEENLSLEDMYHYLIVLVQEYTKKLDMDESTSE